VTARNPAASLCSCGRHAWDPLCPIHGATAASTAIPADVPAEDAEMWCERCGRRHGVVWFAPSDIWNAVMREGDRGNPDEFGFCCPLCFMQLAEARGIVPTAWEVRPEYRPLSGEDAQPLKGTGTC